MICVQKARALSRDKIHVPSSWLWSEKFNGQRAWWDGGVSRGITVVPYRNKGKRASSAPATGLWSSNNNPIYAPDWWLDRLPKGVILDGELWMGRDGFQSVESCVRKLVPVDHEWEQIRYMVFDAPTCDEMFVSRIVSTPTCKTRIIRDEVSAFFGERDAAWIRGIRFAKDGIAAAAAVWEDTVPLQTVGSLDAVEKQAQEIWEDGGEGVVIRNPMGLWKPERAKDVIKMKRTLESEGTIIGVNSGQGKYTGMMGSLWIQWNNGWGAVRFSLSGFTDEERTRDWSAMRGTTVRFRYSDLSRDGVPKEARYMRGGEQ